MRKRIFLPVLVFFICLPLLVFLLSYTRFFNEEVRNLLTSIVDNQTNARLYIGEIHGSILSSFKIEGAALMYHDAPIALVDTIEISHLPLSLITKTAEVLNVDLVNPRFYLTKYKDGTYNVNHISKQPSKTGGKLDWTVMLKSLRILGGRFSLYDSTARAKNNTASTSADSLPIDVFDASHFTLSNINLSASANVSGDKLTAGIKDISLNIEHSGFTIDSLRFDFSTSDAGTEVSNFYLKSNSTQIRADLDLIGQNLLDSLDVKYLRQKHFTASIEASGVGTRQLGKFIDLPLNPVYTFSLTCFASGSLDTLKVKQFFLTTGSSYVPAAATFYNVIDSSMTMKVQMANAVINTGELSALLKNIDFPVFGDPIIVNADAEGQPRDLNVGLQMKSGGAEILGSSHIYDGYYDGKLTFRGIDVGHLLKANFLKTQFSGDVTFSLRPSTSKIPDGEFTLKIDSSNYDNTAIQNGTVDVTSDHDSLGIKLNLSTTSGKISGTAELDVATKTYDAEMSFTELDIAPFVRVPTLKGNFSGGFRFSGSGFSIDSIDAQASILINYGTLGDFPVDNSTFTVTLNTKNVERDLSMHSPFLDVAISGDFVPDKLPSQLSAIFLTLAKTFSSRITGKSDSTHAIFAGVGNFNTSVDVKVKDARFVGKLLGVTELYGNPNAHLNFLSDRKSFSMEGGVTIDTLDYANDSVHVNASKMNVQFNLRTGDKLFVWDSGSWSVNGSLGTLGINGTRITSKVLKVDYTAGDSSQQNSLSISTIAQVDTLLEFYVDASAKVEKDSIDIMTSTLLGKLYGVSLTSEAPVHVVYSPEAFRIYPAIFSAGFSDDSIGAYSKIFCDGTYSIEDGADLHFMFSHAPLAALEKFARLDTNSLKLNGEINGDANLSETESGLMVAIDFNGTNINYNGSAAKLIDGNVKINNDYAELSAQLSKENDSTRYALRMGGIVPLSSHSRKNLDLNLAADSLDISFLTPFLAGVNNFGGLATGNMDVSGKYSSPEFRGSLQVADGMLLLAANQIPYSFAGTIIGQGGDRLFLSPLKITSAARKTAETMTATGPLRIDNNTIEEFDIKLDGTLLALNSTSRTSKQGIYGTAVVGSGESGLMLKGSLARPSLEGSVKIQSADLTLLPLQKKSGNTTQQIIYHFATDTSARFTTHYAENEAAAEAQPESSGSIIDSLRYNLDVETKDNVGLTMIFDPNTDEKLYALLGGRLHLSNLSGTMVLTGDVNIQNNSYYDFYKQFAATGKLVFTGDPLNPTLDITAEYQGDLDTSSSKPQVVVIQIKMAGTFNVPKPDISMTVDNSPFQGDAQTNAISFILTGQFEDELSSSAKQSAANNVWSQAGAGVLGSVGSSVLSGALTNLFAEQFSFIQSVGLQYNPNSNITDPNLQIRSRIAGGTLTVQSPLVTSDIGNTGFTLTYPMPFLSSLVAEASRSVEVTNRTLNQREAIDMMRFYFQLSF